METRTVKEASVEGVQRRTKPKKHFMFCVKVSWSDGTVNLVYRRYSEFLHLQTILYQAFPGSLGRPNSKRKTFTPLPDSFTTRMNVGESIFTRMELVSCFLKDILALEHNVSQSQHIRKFLTPKQEDLEPLPCPQARRVKFKKTARGRRRSSNLTQTVRGRFQKFGKTKIWGNKISSPIILEHFVVMDDYKKIAKSDINLKKGKVVDVIEKRECGWWLVESEGEVGWAPALYLEPADEMVEMCNVQTFAVGRGEIYVTAKRYVAVEDDELSFEIGVSLQILEKNYDGWWKASYLGREGLVPAMYLKKLGYDRRRSSAGRRKSRLFAKNQLRDDDDDEDDHGIIQEIPQLKNKKAGRKKKTKFAVEEDDGKSNGTVVEMSTDFLQLNKRAKKPQESPRPGTPDKAKTLPAQSSPRPKLQHKAMGSLVFSLHNLEETSDKGTKDDTSVEYSQSTEVLQLNKRVKKEQESPRPGTPVKARTLPARGSPRPKLQHKAMSSLVSSLHKLEDKSEKGTKDDISVEYSRSRSMEVMPTRQNANEDGHEESKWRPEIKAAISSSLNHVNEVSESNQGGSVNRTTDQPGNALNDLSSSNVNFSLGDENDSGSLQHDQNSDVNNMNSSDMIQESTATTELAESPKSFSEPPRDPPSICELPVDSSRYFQTISIGGDSPRFQSPKRTPPVPSNSPQRSLVDSPKTAAPKRIPPSPMSKGDSADRKLIRQQSLERETSVELNEEIQYWSSSDESEPELAQMSLNSVVLHPKTGTSPAIVVDETEQSTTGGEETRKRFDQHENVSLNGSIYSTESIEIQVTVPPTEEDFSSNIYRAIETCEVDDEMHLAKGDYVQVLEKASTGFWLVKNEEGMKGWISSGLLCPAPEIHGETECTLQEEEFDEQECALQMSCRAIEDYSGDHQNQEIDLRRGEYLRVLHKSEGGWWCVQNEEGEIGWAPSNYLEVFEDEDIEFSSHVGK